MKEKRFRRILMVITSSELGGAQSVLLQLANALCEQHTIMVVSNSGGQMWDLLNPKIIKNPIAFLRKEISAIDDVRVALKLYSINREFNPDIVHLHSSKIGAIGRIVFPKNKIIYTVHGFDTILKANKIFLPVEKLLKSYCKFIVSVSEYDKVNLSTVGIIENVHTIINGLIQIPHKDLNIFHDNGRKRILCIARLNPPKNHKLFISIARKLPEYDFYWIGNQDPCNEVITGNVYFLGQYKDAGQFFKQVDLCLLTSNYEGLPMTIVEAMSYAKPVVASNVGGISEVVRNNQNGFVCKNDESSFVNAIQLILENDNLQKEMGINSYTIYTNELTCDIMLNKYLNLYMQI